MKLSCRLVKSREFRATDSSTFVHSLNKFQILTTPHAAPNSVWWYELNGNIKNLNNFTHIR